MPAKELIKLIKEDEYERLLKGAMEEWECTRTYKDDPKLAIKALDAYIKEGIEKAYNIKISKEDIQKYIPNLGGMTYDNLMATLIGRFEYHKITGKWGCPYWG